jgi:hypothetical protein
MYGECRVNPETEGGSRYLMRPLASVLCLQFPGSEFWETNDAVLRKVKRRGPRHGTPDRNWLRRLISKQNHTFHPWSNSSLRKRDDKLGRDHLLSLEAAYLLGEIYFHDQTCVKLERYVEASLYHFTALEGRRELLGTDHEDYRNSFHRVAVIAYRDKDYTQALDKFERMIEERLTRVPDGKCPDI